MLIKFNKFLFFALFVFSFQLYAQIKFEKGANLSAYLYSENQVWKIKVNQYKMGWPELVQEKFFSNQYLALQYLYKNQYVQKFSEFKLEGSEAELRGSSQEMIWVAKNSWTWEWELKFAEWIQNEVDLDFFEKNKIATDCADVMYGLRWIFSRINYLPAANRIMDNVYFTNRSLKDEWRNLPTDSVWQKDKRFMKALNFIMNQTYTHTLYKDSYPIALNAQAIWPGAFNLQVRKKSGHTMVIYRRQPASDGIKILIFASTIPKIIRSLSESRMYPAVYTEGEAAILRMRWPYFSGDKVGLISTEQMPFYSKEQFSGKQTNINRILNPNPDWKIEYDDSIKSIQNLLEQRKQVVEEGYKVCFPNKCKPESVEYENYSTPSRDQRLIQAINLLYQELANEYVDFDTRIKTEIIFEIFGNKLTCEDVLFYINKPFFSSNPNHSVERRWSIGEKNYIDSGVQYFQEELLIRRSKINEIAKACATFAQKEKCGVGSENYLKLNLYDQQSNLKSVLQAFVDFKNNFPASSSNVDATLEGPLLTDGHLRLNIKEWIKIINRAAADPRANLNLFEGDFSNRFEKIILPEGVLAEQFGMHLNIKNPSKQFEIWKLDKETNLHIPRRIYFKSENEELLYISLAENRVIVFSEGEVYLFTVNPQKLLIQFPKELININDILSFYENKMLIQTPKSNALGEITFSKNIIFDLDLKKTIYYSEEKEDIVSFDFSKNMKYARQVVKSSAASVNAQNKLYELSKPNSEPILIEGNIPGLANIEEIIFKDEKILFLEKNNFFIFSKSDKVLKSYYPRIKTLNNKKGFLVEYQPENIVFKSIELNKNELTVNEEDILRIPYGQYDYQFMLKDSLVAIKNNENSILSVLAKENTFAVVKSDIRNVKIQDKSDYSVVLNFENKKLNSSIIDKNGNILAVVFGVLSENLIPELNHPENFLFTHPSEYTLGPISTKDAKEILTGSYHYRISDAGYLIFGENEIYILK